MTKRAISYARVSYYDRDTDGRILNGQVEMCREYITRNAYQRVAELAEDARGASGADIALPAVQQPPRHGPWPENSTCWWSARSTASAATWPSS